ncbi:uncharacterized protein LOC135481407 [Liolophura sinensis]|uniref:uncharacterized protein LOC135481407 n=1 Tax=Liolophura sinensis TaxID=3198878 RepID=UPI003159416E
MVPKISNKERYVLHYRNLQQYISLGMRLTKVHRALRIDQSPWMEPYIRMNTKLRKTASKFEKDLYKLMINSVFGKTMENLWKRVDIKLVRSGKDDKLRRLIASPCFARANIFDDDLAAVQTHKTRLVLTQPIYVGMSILDLSKHLMYDFYYHHMKSQYGDVTSDYPQDHPLHSEANVKVLGKIKDECAGRPIAEYIGLRPKMYSILKTGGANIKKAKGVKKGVVEKRIRHKQYQEALFKKKIFRHGMGVVTVMKTATENRLSDSILQCKQWLYI